MNDPGLWKADITLHEQGAYLGRTLTAVGLFGYSYNTARYDFEKKLLTK